LDFRATAPRAAPFFVILLPHRAHSPCRHPARAPPARRRWVWESRPVRT